MDSFLPATKKSVDHLSVLEETFSNPSNYDSKIDFELYKQSSDLVAKSAVTLGIPALLYGRSGRRMILADIIEYVLVGRSYLSLKRKADKQEFIKLVLNFVNLLMTYEIMTVSNTTRKAFLAQLAIAVPEVKNESSFQPLASLVGTVGLKKGESSAPKELDDYFDTLLPKTAGGLWHELLV